MWARASRSRAIRRSCCSGIWTAASSCRSSPSKARPVSNPQVNGDGDLQHLLTLEGLPAPVIDRILDTALPFVSIAERDVKKVPLLRGKTVFNLFFDKSTPHSTTVA